MIVCYITDEGMIHCSNCGTFIGTEYDEVPNECACCWQLNEGFNDEDFEYPHPYTGE